MNDIYLIGFYDPDNSTAIRFFNGFVDWSVIHTSTSFTDDLTHAVKYSEGEINHALSFVRHNTYGESSGEPTDPAFIAAYKITLSKITD